jgi:deoxyribodipyrimidine photolyase
MTHRAIELNDLSQMEGTVIYWMSRDQRVDDNWALLYAQSMANQDGSYGFVSPVRVAYGIVWIIICLVVATVK